MAKNRLLEGGLEGGGQIVGVCVTAKRLSESLELVSNVVCFYVCTVTVFAYTQSFLSDLSFAIRALIAQAGHPGLQDVQYLVLWQLHSATSIV